MSLNREYKDSVFSFLFNDPDALRELYSALEGVPLPPGTPVTINTLSNVIFKGQLNDLSFTIDNKLVVLIEHQSTINPNIALRILMYIGRVYERIIDRKKVYSGTLITIPRPEFIVLYNGTGPYPEQTSLKLSDAFADTASVKGCSGTAPDLELLVKVYNINAGHNERILKKCERLKGYSLFVDKVREYRKSISDKEQAFTEAMKYCVENNILRQFLESHSSEVINMLITEWNTEEWGEVQREEGREKGREEGREETAKNMLLDNMPPAKVSQYTGLPLDTINSIASTLNI
jgi:hypothetical protein